MTIKAGIIGATGYAGLEIARLLTAHPQTQLTAVSSISFTGQKLSQVYPSVARILDTVLTDDTAVVEECDVVFASLPHGLSEETAALCYKKGKIFIDMGADFRLHKEEEYARWYGGVFTDQDLHQKAVYAIPELFREEIRSAKLIANPGCYPTSISLGLAPLLKKGLMDVSSLIIDAKSGVTGAGRSLTANTHFPECNESFSPYKVAEHRHTPEIEQTLSILAGKKATITFVPHLLPVNRGILSTIYASAVETITAEDLQKLYQEFYKGETFVRILPLGVTANIQYVKYSNYCDISLHADHRTGRVIIVAAIDNMMKGAAGQAVQNMNLVCGLPEEMGLELIPPAF